MSIESHANNGDRKSLFHQPTPDSMRIDVNGLIESWVADAEDWLTTWQDAQSMSSGEAFDGIEYSTRLMRTAPEKLKQVGGTEIAKRIAKILKDHGESFANKAIQLPDAIGWLTLATEEFDHDSDDASIAIELLENAESLDFLLGFIEQYGSDELLSTDQYQEVSEGRNLIHRWIDDHADHFIICEGHVRACCLAIRWDIQTIDPTGWLELSTAIYLPILRVANQAWRDCEPVFSLPVEMLTAANKTDRVYALPTERHLPSEFLRATLEVSMAAAKGDKLVPQKPLQWLNQSGDQQAECYLPAKFDDSTNIEIDFYLVGSGDKPAVQLIGRPVTLGGASGTIQSSAESPTRVFVTLNYSQLNSGREGELKFDVGGQTWWLQDDV